MSLERDVFSIMRPDAFKKLNDPKSRGDDIGAYRGCHEWIVYIFHTMGQVPIIRCPKECAAEMVGRELRVN